MEKLDDHNNTIRDIYVKAPDIVTTHHWMNTKYNNWSISIVDGGWKKKTIIKTKP